MARDKPRPRRTIIQVCVSKEERAIIQGLADETNLSVSAYLKQLGLTYQPVPALDVEHMIDLTKHIANLGRLGGLLKLWLTSDKKLAGEKPEELAAAIKGILPTIEHHQKQLNAIIKKVSSRRAAEFAGPATANDPAPTDTLQ